MQQSDDFCKAFVVKLIDQIVFGEDLYSIVLGQKKNERKIIPILNVSRRTKTCIERQTKIPVEIKITEIIICLLVITRIINWSVITNNAMVTIDY